MTPSRRWPAVALLRTARRLMGADEDRMSNALDVSLRTLQRWKQPKATLSDLEADRFAVRLGLHPAAVWPNWWDGADERWHGNGNWYRSGRCDCDECREADCETRRLYRRTRRERERNAG